jgi:hypothetical protein
MTETHCMIDIETLGRDHGAIPISVGAVTFTVADGVDEELYIEIDPEDCQERGLTADVSTFIWWIETDAEEAADVVPGGEPLDTALKQLTMFYQRHGCSTIWAKSPIFDVSIIEHCYGVCGMKHPWRFYETRDVRTILNRSAAVKEEHGEDEQKHNAVDDARVQAQAVAKTLEKLDE